MKQFLNCGYIVKPLTKITGSTKEYYTTIIIHDVIKGVNCDDIIVTVKTKNRIICEETKAHICFWDQNDDVLIRFDSDGETKIMSLSKNIARYLSDKLPENSNIKCRI